MAQRRIIDLLTLPASPGDLANIYIGVDNTNLGASYKVSLETLIAMTQAGNPKRSEFVAIADIPSGTPIDMNAATASYTSAIGLDYTSHDPGTAVTFNDKYGATLWAYVNGLKVQQADISRNDADPAGFIRLAFDVPNTAEIVFESQVPT